MFRYRCPHCTAVHLAAEIRAGKPTVCPKCSRLVTIPADQSQWLNEKGEPLLHSPTVVIPTGTTPPPLARTHAIDPVPPSDGDNDVLGAISHGNIELPSFEGDTRAPKAEPQPAFSRSLPAAEEEDGRVELYPSSPLPEPVAETPLPPATPPKLPTPPLRFAPGRSTPTPPPPRRAEPESTSIGPRELPPGAVALPEPLKLRTGMDLAVDLTSALAARMKPPPRPPRDLKPSTAVWILTTGLGVALILGTLLSSNNFVETVIAIGVAQIIAGYAWVTAIAFRRDAQRGIACAVPPVTFWYLMNEKYAKFRPLRFVISGTVMVGLALLAPKIQAQTRSWAGISEAPAPVVAPPEIASQPRLNQLRYYRDQRQYDLLIGVLRTLARTDSMYSEESKHRVEIVADLGALCKHPDSGVRIEALPAYATWGGPDARERTMEASRSQNRDERRMALRVLPRWKDEDVARRIAEMITSRGDVESSDAADSLITLGGPVAERAAIPLLRKDEQNIRLKAIEILGDERVGGLDAIAALREVVRTSPDPGTRQSAEIKLQQIAERQKK